MITLEKSQRPEMKGEIYTDIGKIIDDFKRGGCDCVILRGWKHKTAKSLAGSINNYIKRNRIPFVKVETRRGEVYLINTLKEDLKKG
jgi:hypothetical protein